MDHSDKIKQNLEILGLASLEGLSLIQLQDAISKDLPTDVSEKRILNIYVMWLHERLMAVDISAQDEVTNEITAWYWFLKAMGNSGRDIAEAFSDWQHAQVLDDPASSRRLSIAEAELRLLIPPAAPPPSKNSPDVARLEKGYGQMHPDRVKWSQATEIIEIDDDEPDIIEARFDAPYKNRYHSRDAAAGGQLDLSFLTGANSFAMSDIAESLPDKNNNVPHAYTDSSPTSLASRVVTPRGGKTGTFTKPRPGYVCKRCDKPGHLLQECPTNLDPAFDQTPSSDYICKICHKAGDHDIQLCPKNKDPKSVTQQRRRAWGGNTRHGEGRRVGYDRDLHMQDKASRYGTSDPHRYDTKRYEPLSYGDRSSGRSRSRSPVREVGGRRQRDEFNPKYINRSRHRSRSSSPVRQSGSKRRRDGISPEYDDRSLERGRSRSPVRRPGGKRQRDDFMPEYESTSGRLVPSNHHVSKRKARSPPPFSTFAPSKKTRAQDNEPAKKVSTKKVGFVDLVDEIKPKDEGRLSFHDDYDGIVPATPLPQQSTQSWEGKEMDVDTPEKSGKLDTAVEIQLIHSTFKDMIKTESTKTELVLLIDGIDYSRPYSVPVAKLLRNQKDFWIHEAIVNKDTRRCSMDYYAVTDESLEELIKRLKREIVAERPIPKGMAVGPTMEVEPADMRDEEKRVNSAMEVDAAEREGEEEGVDSVMEVEPVERKGDGETVDSATEVEPTERKGEEERVDSVMEVDLVDLT